MKKLLLGCALGILAVSCGGPKDFKVEVEAPGLGTQLMTVIYTLPDGNRSVMTLPAVDGKFEFSGSSSEPSIIEIFTAGNAFYTALIAQNGDKIKLEVNKDDDSRTVEGSELSARLLELAGTFTDSTDISGEPEVIRTALTSIYATAVRDVTGLTFVSPELIIGRDTTTTLPPEGIWVFTSTQEERTPELIDTLRHYHKAKRPVRDIWIGVDTMQWRMITRPDSAKWTRAMVPDAPLALREVLRSTPMLLEVDTTGTVIRAHKFE